MIKDLVVNLTVGNGRDAAAQFAISIAARFGAHIAGIAFAYDPVITPTVMDGLSATWVDAQRAENRATAQEAVDRFESAVKPYPTPGAAAPNRARSERYSQPLL